MANEIILGITTTSDTGGLEKVEESVKSIKQQLKEAQAEVVAMSDKFGDTSKEAIAAAKSAAVLKDKIGDSKALTDAFNPDAKFKALSGSLVGVAGGFSALTGAMAMFGNENKDVEKAILKVQSAMALASGLQAVGESVDAFKQLGAVIKSTTIFQTISTAAQKLWNATMSANPIGAIVLVMTTLIAAGYGLIKMFETSNKTLEVSTTNIDKNKKSVEKQTEAIEKSRIAKENLDLYELRLMKAQGKSEEAILKRTIAIRKANVADANSEFLIKTQTKEIYQNTIANYENAQSQLDKRIAAEGWFSLERKMLQDEKEDNKLYLQGAKENVDASILAYNSAAKNLADARELEKKAEQDYEVLKYEQIVLGTKKRLTKTEEGNKIIADNKQAADAKIVSDQQTQDALEKSILEKSISEKENLLADSATKKAILQHTRNVAEINQIKDLNKRKIALENEADSDRKRMDEAIAQDADAEYNQSIEFSNLADIGFESDLEKQLAHYKHLLTIQEDYQKSTIEIDQKITETKKQIAEKELEWKTYSLNKGVEVAAQAGQLLQQIAGESKAAAIGGIVIEKAASIANIIASTFAANAGFTKHPASLLTFGGAAALPVALNTASGAIGIASIIAQAAKSISEINGTKASSSGAKQSSKFAMGGLIKGMGTGTSDSILANLSNGESVINAKSTAMFGNLLSNINEMGGGVSFGNNNNSKNNGNNIFKTYVVASEMSSQIEATNRIKQIARL